MIESKQILWRNHRTFDVIPQQWSNNIKLQSQTSFLGSPSFHDENEFLWELNIAVTNTAHFEM